MKKNLQELMNINNSTSEQAPKDKLVLNKKTIVKFLVKEMQDVAGGKDIATTNSSGVIDDDKCTGRP